MRGLLIDDLDRLVSPVDWVEFRSVIALGRVWLLVSPAIEAVLKVRRLLILKLWQAVLLLTELEAVCDLILHTLFLEPQWTV